MTLGLRKEDLRKTRERLRETKETLGLRKEDLRETKGRDFGS